MFVSVGYEGDTAVTVACHLAGHKLSVAGSPGRLTATVMTTATHAAVVREIGNEKVQDVGESSPKTTEPWKGRDNVDDVSHYWSVYISRTGLSGSESGFSTFSSLRGRRVASASQSLSLRASL